MHYHFGYPFNPWGAGVLDNVCVEQGTDGTWYGFEHLAFGTVQPTHNVADQRTYSIKWNAAGDFIVSFGDAGDEQVPDLYNGSLQFSRPTGDESVAIAWSSVNTQYEGNNLELATDLIDTYVLGEEVCLSMRGTPDLFIDYDFELKTGAD